MEELEMQVRYYISSANLKAEKFASSIREHWSIESVPQAHKFAA